MVREVDAIFEDGILRPLEPLALQEKQLVHLTVEDGRPETNSGLKSFSLDRSAEMAWLSTESSAYVGQYVALKGSRLVAHGPTLESVFEAADEAGVDRPLFVRVPMPNEASFGGW